MRGLRDGGTVDDLVLRHDLSTADHLVLIAPDFSPALQYS
jgi:hypothetical protein